MLGTPLRLHTVRPKLHVIGHIHDGYGVTVSDVIPGTTFLNAYKPVNSPQRFVLAR